MKKRLIVARFVGSPPPTQAEPKVYTPRRWTGRSYWAERLPPAERPPKGEQA